MESRCGLFVLRCNKKWCYGGRGHNFFNKQLAVEAEKLIKQTGHVLSKTRFISAQLTAWFQDSLWISLADKANFMANYLSRELSKFNEFKLAYQPS